MATDPNIYSFNRDGVPEAVVREAWRWEAYYTDGSVAFQFDDRDHSFHQFAEIDQTRLAVFKMVHDNRPAIILDFPQGAKLVHKYINTVLNVGTKNETRTRMYIAGYETDRASTFACILNTGEVVITADPNNVRVS